METKTARNVARKESVISNPRGEKSSRPPIASRDAAFRAKDKKLRGKLKALKSRQRATLEARRDAEILLENTPGFLEPENELERTYKIRQEDIRRDIAIETAKKGYELRLEELGPYVMDYTRNGRSLLLAGRKGHVATITDAQGSPTCCEIQLCEIVRDAKWLHNDQYFALAQKKSVYIYDKSGVQLHELRKHIEVRYMEFLPYHFLLATIGNAGYIKYTDTSTGQMIIELPTKQGVPTAFGHSLSDAIVHVGHQNGTVSFWSPNSTTPLVKILAHRGPVRALATDREGRYMVCPKFCHRTL
jgi:U3 small nucleolar RNA-associated protein 7